ncbi:hypothetical protein JNO54_09840 [Janibacter sp. YIM B02568]|uniref:hypothetical protein n=1 Tax=Janibacter endophyticus TaxID=2806261 RepID=UPI0019502E2D|nr:hypothetical protein [Janibacter endophyticus]MBM6546438.1 hypothetical protein [Janibacter endophyticus]
MSAKPIYHCPFCAEEDLRPVEEPRGAWACGSCVRVFSVTLHRTDLAEAGPVTREEQR